MEQYRPYFSLKFDVSGCDFDFLLNGISIHKSISNGQSSSYAEVPVNKWVLPGENKLNFRIFYAEDDTERVRADAKVVLRVREKDAERNTAIPIVKLSLKGENVSEESSFSRHFDSRQGFGPSEEGDVVVDDVVIGPSATNMRQGITVSRTMEIPAIFPEWSFAKSDRISDKHQTEMSLNEYAEFSEKIKSELLPIYEKIHIALETGEIDPILPLFEERNGELEQAYFLRPGEVAEDLSLAFYAAADGAAGTLADIDPGSLFANVSYNLRLVNLVYPPGRPVINFKHSGSGMHLVDDIVFRKSGDKWIITR